MRNIIEKKQTEIKLEDSELEKIQQSVLVETILSEIAEATPITRIIKKLFSYNETVNEEVNARKKELIISKYLKKTENHQESIDKIIAMLSSPTGFVIFNKIMAISDNQPLDLEILNNYSTLLKNIIETGSYDELYSDYHYALNLIDNISPQAISLIIDKDSWDYFYLDEYRDVKRIITTDWTDEFSTMYYAKKGITEERVKQTINSAVIEIRSNNLVRAEMPAYPPKGSPKNNRGKFVELKLTAPGLIISRLFQS